MNKLKVFIVLVLLSFKSFACLNGESKYLKNGEIAYIDFRGLVPHGHNFSNFKSSKILIELDSLYRKTNDIEYLSDKGYVLIIQKKYHEALQLYLNIEKIKPNRYSTASNIGTLYELMGENQKAYNWIKKSIEINPESHNGSEWLHLKILEAKIKKLNTVTSSFLINTDFGSIGGPQTNLSKEEVDKLAHEIYFQVNERMSFIKPKDKIISILLFELGNLAELKGESENALRIYKSALTYGYEGDLIVPRMINSAIGKSREYEKKSRELSLALEKNKNRTALDYVNRIERSLIILSVFSTILLISFIVFFYKWKNLKKSISTS